MNKTIIVIGDIMLDRYVEGSVTRISPEAPVPVLNVKSETFKLGGAANVAHNLNRLGIDSVLIGAIGKDMYGARVKELMDLEALSSDRLVHDHSITTVKTRILSKSHQMIRIDREETYSPNNTIIDQIRSSIHTTNPECIIISDYNKGVITPFTMKAVFEEANKLNIKVIIDPKDKNWNKYEGAYLIKPNLKELKEASLDIEGTVEETLKALFNRYYFKNILVTRSSNGMSLINKNGITNYPVQEAEVYDVTGAGDTAIAVIGYGILSDLSLEDSIKMANIASAYVVTKNRTYAISKEELDQLI